VLILKAKNGGLGFEAHLLSALCFFDFDFACVFVSAFLLSVFCFLFLNGMFKTLVGHYALFLFLFCLACSACSAFVVLFCVDF
jgi:hypothetical protein